MYKRIIQIRFEARSGQDIRNCLLPYGKRILCKLINVRIWQNNAYKKCAEKRI